MGACRDSLPDTVWDGLFASIVRVSPSFTQQGLVSCMIGEHSYTYLNTPYLIVHPILRT